MPQIQIKDGINLTYSLDGPQDAPLVVLMHGYCGNHKDMIPLRDRLKQKYRTLIYDHRGHGDSDKPKGATEEENRGLYSMSRLATDLDELVSALGLDDDKFTVAGHSMGGMIAYTYYFLFPDKVNALIPISTTLGYNDQGKEAMAQLVDEFKNSTTFTRTKESVKQSFIATAYSRKYVKAHPEEIDEGAEMNLKTAWEAYIYCLEDFSLRYDYRDRMDQIQVPVLVLHGKRDGMQPWQNAAEMEMKIPNCQAVFIDKGPHMITIEHVDEVADAILNFVEKIL